MNSYRVVSRHGEYVAQEKAFIGWRDLFCGAMSDLPDTFSTPEAAMQKVQKLEMARRKSAPVNYEQTFYIADNGQICPTRDWA